MNHIKITGNHVFPKDYMGSDCQMLVYNQRGYKHFLKCMVAEYFTGLFRDYKELLNSDRMWSNNKYPIKYPCIVDFNMICEGVKTFDIDFNYSKVDKVLTSLHT